MEYTELIYYTFLDNVKETIEDFISMMKSQVNNALSDSVTSRYIDIVDSGESFWRKKIEDGLNHIEEVELSDEKYWQRVLDSINKMTS